MVTVFLHVLSGSRGYRTVCYEVPARDGHHSVTLPRMLIGAADLCAHSCFWRTHDTQRYSRPSFGCSRNTPGPHRVWDVRISFRRRQRRRWARCSHRGRRRRWSEWRHGRRSCGWRWRWCRWWGGSRQQVEKAYLRLEDSKAYKKLEIALDVTAPVTVQRSDGWGCFPNSASSR